MKKLLYIDACVNRDISRTERLAQALLKEMNKNGEYEVETSLYNPANFLDSI